jgi:hypothetical protein
MKKRLNGRELGTSPPDGWRQDPHNPSLYYLHLKGRPVARVTDWPFREGVFLQYALGGGWRGLHQFDTRQAAMEVANTKCGHVPQKESP